MDIAQLYWYAAAIFAASTPAALLAGRLDQRTLDGENVWNKPAKFGISLGLHFATFASVSDVFGNGTFLFTVAWLSIVAAGIEAGYFAVQASRQRRSHFNMDTRIEAAIYAGLGVGALFVLLPAVVIGVVAAISPPAAWPPAVRLAVPVAFLVGSGLTLLITLWMGRQNSRYAGPVPAEPRTMWLTGWTVNAADLRPAHFLGTHIMQGVPLIALAGSWLLSPSVALVLAATAAVTWTAVTLVLFRRTVAGKSLPAYFAAFA